MEESDATREKSTDPIVPRFWRRWVGYALDGYICEFILTSFREWIIDVPSTGNAEIFLRAYLADTKSFALVTTAFSLFYLVLMHWIYGRTIGKMICCLRVVDATGKKISFLQACVRVFFAVGILMPLAHILPDISRTYQVIMAFAAVLYMVYDGLCAMESAEGISFHDRMAKTRVIVDYS